VTALEDQLRTELRAEAQLITPDDLAALRLPDGPGQEMAGWRRAGPRHWPAWTKPLAAAAAVIAVIAGTLALTHAVTRPRPAAGPPADYSRAPAYYAYDVEGDIYNYVSHGTQYSAGVGGRYIKVRATSSGELVATISPPKPDNDFTMLTASANGTTFVLGAMRHWERTANSPRQVQRSQRTPMTFQVLRITWAGRTQLTGLSLPEALTPAQRPTAALSPDGRRLAVAFMRGAIAVVQVITLGTGRVREWTLPHAPWQPYLRGTGAWTANGRTLAVTLTPPTVTRSALLYRVPHAAKLRLLDTSAPGSLVAASRLAVLRAPAHGSPAGLAFLTPDGRQLIMPTGKFLLPPGHRPWTGQISIYSARTGALLRTLAPYEWDQTTRPGQGGSPEQAVMWSDFSGHQLVVLQPRQHRNTLGVLRGSEFAPAGNGLLLQQASGYQWLQAVQRSTAQLAW
jgi:hypothetical protein